MELGEYIRLLQQLEKRYGGNVKVVQRDCKVCHKNLKRHTTDAMVPQFAKRGSDTNINEDCIIIARYLYN